MAKYVDVFQEGLGIWDGYAMREMVEEEFYKKVHLSLFSAIPSPVEDAEWAAPIVAVLKTDKKSMCGNFRLTVNPASQLVRYPVPKAEDLFGEVLYSSS